MIWVFLHLTSRVAKESRNGLFMNPRSLGFQVQGVPTLRAKTILHGMRIYTASGVARWSTNAVVVQRLPVGMGMRCGMMAKAPITTTRLLQERIFITMPLDAPAPVIRHVGAVAPADNSHACNAVSKNCHQVSCAISGVS
jgi:hypothetical protein